MSAGYSDVSRDSIVCDSSSLISLAEACLLDVIPFLKRYAYGEFLIPSEVHYESVVHPLMIKQYSLRALRLREWERRGYLRRVDRDVKEMTRWIMGNANRIFYVRGKPIHLVDEGEASQIALALDLDVDTLLIDERTTRTLIEAPMKLRAHLEREFKHKVTVDERILNRFLSRLSGLNIIRSSELIALAYTYGYFDDYGEDRVKALEGALYSLKFSGCAISFEEIDEFMREVHAGRL